MSRGKRGTEPQPSAAATRLPFMEDVATPRLQYEQINPLAIGEAVIACLTNDLAVMFGKTSDGGALVMKFYQGDDKSTKYPKNGAELTKLCEEVAGAWDDV